MIATLLVLSDRSMAGWFRNAKTFHFGQNYIEVPHNNVQ